MNDTKLLPCRKCGSTDIIACNEIFRSRTMVVITCNDCNEGDATWVKNAEQGKQICDIITIQSDCTFKNHSEDDTYQKAICLIQRWNKRYIPEQNTFEEIPEIENIIEDYYKPEKTYHVYFQCSVLYGYGLTKEDAEKNVLNGTLARIMILLQECLKTVQIFQNCILGHLMMNLNSY
jgi:hypothetical protein